MNQVGVEFVGGSRGAVRASRETAAAVDQVTASAHRSGPGLKQLGQDIGHVERGALAGAGALHGMGRAALYLGSTYIGAFGLGAAFKAASDELGHQIQLQAQARAELRSTGGVAGVTARAIDALAKVQSRKTAVDEGSIKSAELMLLRFTQVRDVVGDGNNIFKRATIGALDMAAALGGDAASAAATLGKALNDPIRGIGLLRRANVTLTVEEQNQIKTMVAHGNVLSAQKVLLDAVTRSYGGTAKAVGDATPWSKLRNTLNLLLADGLRPLLPEFDHVTKRVADWADGLEHNSAAQERLKHDVQEGVDVVKTFATEANAVATAVGGWRHAIELVLALKVASTVAGWTTSIKALIGTEAAAGAAEGLAGAAGMAGVLRSRLAALAKLGPIIIPVALSFIPPNKKGQEALDKAGIGFLGHLPIVGGAEQWIAKTEASLFGPSFGAGGAAPKTVQVGKDAGATGQSVVRYADRYGASSGIVYHWGGVSPVTGFDCSGYVYSAYAAAGVKIPRDTRGQWNDPNAVKVAPGQERPGDAVYFTGSLTGANAGPPPGHVGIYLGGGIFIEYFSEGKPAKTDNLANRADYMGARRWLKLTDQKGGAEPPHTPPSAASKNLIPASIRQAIAASDVALAQAAITPGKADDQAATAEARRALDDEISYLKSKLATNIGAEKRITLEDLLTGALGSLAGLDSTKKTSKGVGASSIIALRASVNAELKALPADLDDVERQAVAKLQQLRDHLHVGMTSKDEAQTRASIKRWGVVLKNEISKQAQIASDAANAAAQMWQRTWQNDVNRVLRDFQENVIDKQLNQFDRETQRHLQSIQDKFGGQTPEEQALAAFDATRAAADEAKQRADIASQIADVNSQIAALDDASGTLIDIATGQRTAITNADATKQRKDLLSQLAGLNDQAAQLDLQDQRAALQASADLSRTAANAKAQAEQQDYQDTRDRQRQALSDVLSDQQVALQQSLDDWSTNIEKKKRTWLEFLAWLKANGYGTSGLVNPATGMVDDGVSPATGQRVATPGGVAAGSYYGVLSPFNPTQFAAGGKVPGRFVGREDTILARLSPGETVIDRKLTQALEEMVASGGNGGPTYAVFRIGEREIATAIAQPMSSEQARQIGYTMQRG